MGILIVVATGKGEQEPVVDMPEHQGTLGLGKIAVVPASKVRWTMRGKTKREGRPGEFPF